MASQYRDMGQTSITLGPSKAVDWIGPFDISDWKSLQYQIDVIANAGGANDIKYSWKTSLSLDGYAVWTDVLADADVSNTANTSISGELGTGMNAVGKVATAPITLVPWKRFAKLVITNLNTSPVAVTLHTQYMLKERTT